MLSIELENEFCACLMSMLAISILAKITCNCSVL